MGDVAADDFGHQSEIEEASARYRLEACATLARQQSSAGILLSSKKRNSFSSSMGEWLLSQRDRLIVARPKCLLAMRAPVPEGRSKSLSVPGSVLEAEVLATFGDSAPALFPIPPIFGAKTGLDLEQKTK